MVRALYAWMMARSLAALAAEPSARAALKDAEGKDVGTATFSATGGGVKAEVACGVIEKG